MRGVGIEGRPRKADPTSARRIEERCAGTIYLNRGCVGLQDTDWRSVPQRVPL